MAGKINVAILLMCFIVLVVAVQLIQAHGDEGTDVYKVCFMKCFDFWKATGLANTHCEIKCDQLCSHVEKYGKYVENFPNLKP
ncbi:hypothetical protein C5167_006475 [Papaver somniferum]|uniref:Plant thionin family protein n=1 Tax=Papaver somniferum TaxID=3469 RepID=A0A4Y7JHD7_PAPSO|nr:hypothetical protein C5167_006475 [Papaver somniferum]